MPIFHRTFLSHRKPSACAEAGTSAAAAGEEGAAPRNDIRVFPPLLRSRLRLRLQRLARLRLLLRLPLLRLLPLLSARSNRLVPAALLSLRLLRVAAELLLAFDAGASLLLRLGTSPSGSRDHEKPNPD